MLDDLFETEMYPVLTPLAVDPAHPFPYISNLSLNLAVLVTNPKTGEQQFARVKVPQSLPRFIVVEDQEHFVPVEQVIAAHIDRLFPGMDVTGHHPFQITRSADQALEEEEAEDLLEAMESLLVARHRFSRAIRLEVGSDMPENLRDYLVSQARHRPGALYVSDAPLALSGLWGIYGLDRPELKDEPWVPLTQPALADLDERTIFDAIREHDLLIHLPYDSFITSVQAFLAKAAADRNVVAIKQTLYRTSNPDDPALGGETSIVRSLMAAARAGKQVVCLIELKARFDEEANINWARMLEEAGVHVVYGVTGLKTHSKIALVVRREPDGLRRYSHVGTGNYNPKTATLYEDLGILTADEAIGADLSELFNVLTGFSRQKKYRSLLVAPTSLRRKLVRRIRRQAELGSKGRIIFKLNHLVDPADHRRALQGQQCRRRHRSDRQRRLLPPPGRSRHVGAHHGAVDRRQVPGALPDLPLRAGRRRRVPHRLRRHDAAQPQQPGRGRHADQGRRAAGKARRGAAGEPQRRPALLDAGIGRFVDQDPGGRGHQRPLPPRGTRTRQVQGCRTRSGGGGHHPEHGAWRPVA